MATMIYKNGKWSEKVKEAKQQTHTVIQDTLLDPIESMATPDRQKFDSMSKYKQHLKEHGYEITGGDHLKGKGLHDYKAEVDKQGIRNEIIKQYHLIKWGMSPLTQKEIEQCTKEQKAVNQLKLEARYRTKRYLAQKAAQKAQSL